MAAYLDRIDRLNPAVNAIVCRIDRDDLLRQSGAMDAAPYSGWLGDLGGIPLAPVC